ncbi:MAG: fructose-1,6-bisphosphatase [Dehalococcoidia bacterium]|nr:fructose-1,6-bisphosphatase [Dehalococcoidia bacterium]MCA9850169.1 fructose-1,6-bisphosphatase [Dehalococcoidia bacterium]MCB9490751.1 fructose-1,6-bisphosphatase [Dehalococcoidia bacterium]
MTSSPAADLASVLAGRFEREVCDILARFADASAELRDALATAPLSNLLGATGDVNVQGESTQKLDDRANEIFKAALSLSSVARLISEEEDEPIEVGDGRYTLGFDPLDGSSNIGFASVGSVLGVYDGVARNSFDAGGMTGRSLVAAAFTVYGLPTMLIVASREQVSSFAFDPSDRSWRVAAERITVPKATYTSINWTYHSRWSPSVVGGVEAASDGLRGRYSGSMVEDILRVLLAGGVFMYPEDSSSPNGKLRMLYEVCPIGFVMEAAGGAASTGTQPVLDVAVTSPHQRSPFVAGATDAVGRYIAGYGSAS